MSVYIAKRQRAGRAASPGRPKRRAFTAYQLRWGHGSEGYTHLHTFYDEDAAVKGKDRAEAVLLLGGSPSPAMFDGGWKPNGETVKVARRTFKSVALEWLDHQAQHVWMDEAGTEKNQRGYANQLLGYFGEQCEPKVITRDEVKGFYEYMRGERGVSASYLRTIKSTAAQIMDYAQVTPNHFRDKTIAAPTHGGAVRSTPLPTREQMDAIEACLSVEDRRLFLMMRHGGMRVNEACRVKWSDISTTKHGAEQVYLPRTKGTRKNGVIRERWVHEMRYQREAGTRWVPTRRPGDDDAAYVRTPRATDATVRDFVKDAAKAAGVPYFMPSLLRKVHVTEIDLLRAERVVTMTDKEYEARLGHTTDVSQTSYVRTTGRDI